MSRVEVAVLGALAALVFGPWVLFGLGRAFGWIHDDVASPVAAPQRRCRRCSTTLEAEARFCPACRRILTSMRCSRSGAYSESMARVLIARIEAESLTSRQACRVLWRHPPLNAAVARNYAVTAMNAARGGCYDVAKAIARLSAFFDSKDEVAKAVLLAAEEFYDPTFISSETKRGSPFVPAEMNNWNPAFKDYSRLAKRLGCSYQDAFNLVVEVQRILPNRLVSPDLLLQHLSDHQRWNSAKAIAHRLEVARTNRTDTVRKFPRPVIYHSHFESNRRRH